MPMRMSTALLGFTEVGRGAGPRAENFAREAVQLAMILTCTRNRDIESVLLSAVTPMVGKR